MVYRWIVVVGNFNACMPWKLGDVVWVAVYNARFPLKMLCICQKVMCSSLIMGFILTRDAFYKV